jgi:hypothetical protein
MLRIIHSEDLVQKLHVQMRKMILEQRRSMGHH